MLNKETKKYYRWLLVIIDTMIILIDVGNSNVNF